MKTKPLMVFFIGIILILFVINMPACYQAMKEIAWNIIKNPEPVSVKEMISEAESAYKSSFKPRYAFIEANGGLCKISGRYSCNEAIKCFDENVTTVSERIAISEQTNRVIALQKFCKRNGVKFMYVSFPTKEGYESRKGNLPKGVTSCVTDTENQFQKKLAKQGVEIYDMRNMFSTEKEDVNPFFSTDHHWTPESGYYAYKKIAKKLSSEYGYSVDEKSLDIDNYSITTVANDFLGSTGKRTGKLFSGLDSVTEIVPRWNTDIYFYADGEKKIGSYKEVFFKKECLDGKYYNANKYEYYIGADNALTIQKNKEAANPDAKILIIENSFSLVVKPYYSFMFGEVAAIDARRCEINNSIKVAEYIKKENPELVILQYTEGVGSMDGDYGNPYDFGL